MSLAQRRHQARNLRPRQGLHFRSPWFGCSYVVLPSVTPSPPCRRALKVAMETVMSESDMFASSTRNFNHFGPHEEVEKQCVRLIHRAWVCGKGDAGKFYVFAFHGSGDHVFFAECEPLFFLEFTTFRRSSSIATGICASTSFGRPVSCGVYADVMSVHFFHFRFTVTQQYWRPSWLFTLTFFRIVSTLLSERNNGTWRSP